jgi:hypothetical protein
MIDPITKSSDLVITDPMRQRRYVSHPADVLELIKQYALLKNAEFSGYWTGPTSEPMLFFTWSSADEKTFFMLETLVAGFPWFEKHNSKLLEMEPRSSICSNKPGLSKILFRGRYMVYLPSIEE